MESSKRSDKSDGDINVKAETKKIASFEFLGQITWVSASVEIKSNCWVIAGEHQVTLTFANTSSRSSKT
jgi:hypothetical protein